MTEEEFKGLEEKYFRAKQVRDLITEISYLCCPLCGHSLTGSVGKPDTDTWLFHAHIDCKGCDLFHAESKNAYHCGDRNNETIALKDVMARVDPYIKACSFPVKDAEK